MESRSGFSYSACCVFFLVVAIFRGGRPAGRQTSIREVTDTGYRLRRYWFLLCVLSARAVLSLFFLPYPDNAKERRDRHA